MIHEKVRITSLDEEKVKIGFTALHGYNSLSLHTGLGVYSFETVASVSRRASFLEEDKWDYLIIVVKVSK